MTIGPECRPWPPITAGSLRLPGVVGRTLGKLLGPRSNRVYNAELLEYFPRQHATASGAWEYYERFLGTPERRLRILDVGCGAGARTAAHASKTDGIFVCVDLDLPLMRDAAASLARPGVFRFAQADATRLPFDDSTFDVCLCENVLEHFDRPDLAIAELGRVLRPGGHLFAFFPPWRGPFSGHLTSVTSMPWIHLLWPSFISRVLVLSQSARHRGERFEPSTVVARLKGLNGHLNGWSLDRILDAVGRCGDLKPVDAYAVGEWRISRLLRFLPWIGEFFTGAVYLVYTKSHASDRSRRLRTFNSILIQMARRHFSRATQPQT